MGTKNRNKRKKCVALATLIALMILPACGNPSTDLSSTSSTAESVDANALDLQGSWVAENQNDSYYLAGFIKDDIVELHWVSNYDQYGSLYWGGSYKAPKKDTNTYTWESKRDDAMMAMAAGFGAPDQSRTFTYEDGKLILEASDLSYEVVLIPSEVDYTGLAVEVSDEDREKAKKDTEGELEATEDEATEEKSSKEAENIKKAEEEKTKDVKVIDTGYAIEQVGNGVNMVYYGVEISNPNKYNAILSPNIEITVRNSDGGLVSKQHRTLAGLAPRTRVTFGDTIKCNNGAPDEVSIEVTNTDYDIVPFEGSDVVMDSDLEVADVKESSVDSKVIYTGKVKNKTDKKIDRVLISVVYYNDGQVVGGSTEYVDGLKAKGSKNFEVKNKSKFKGYDTYEVYAFGVVE